jgi:hypothetical protein
MILSPIVEVGQWDVEMRRNSLTVRHIRRRSDTGLGALYGTPVQPSGRGIIAVLM